MARLLAYRRGRSGPLRANRMLSFAYKRFDRVVPELGNPSCSSAKGLDDVDRSLIEKVEALGCRHLQRFAPEELT